WILLARIEPVLSRFQLADHCLALLLSGRRCNQHADCSSRRLQLVLFPVAAAALMLAVVPGLDSLQHTVALRPRRPNRFILLQANLVVPFALAFVVAAKMGYVRHPHDAIDRNMLVIHKNENRR